MSVPRQRILFVTGKLAAPALEAEVARLANVVGFEPVLYVAKISVAALMSCRWLAGRFEVPGDVDRVILPGWCDGDLNILQSRTRASVERGPKNLHDLPSFFAQPDVRRERYGAYDVEILAEINHADRLDRDTLAREALRMAADGADVIDLGSTPGARWETVADRVRALRDEGLRVSIDSFDEWEVRQAVGAGAELVLSVHRGNLQSARSLDAEVVVIPEDPARSDWADQLEVAAAYLERHGVRHRLDPVLEPIGFGFAASLGRYLEARRRFPQARMLMGVGNLTELTAVDSAGVNALLLGFCQELGVRSVLTTEVIHWARTSIREIDLARRLMHFAVAERVPPKHVDDRLVVLRDGKPLKVGEEELRRLAERIVDPNVRLFAEGGIFSAIRGGRLEQAGDPYELFERLNIDDPAHAFYLGWELMKASLALELGKRYVQDEALRFGFLTKEEPHRRGRDRRGPGGTGEGSAP